MKKRRAARFDDNTEKVVETKVKRSFNPLNKEGFKEIDLGVNPFLSNFTILVNSLTMKGQYRKDGDDLLPTEVDFDRQQSTRLYISPNYRKIAMGLSGNELRLFVWIAYEANQGKDYLWINVNRFLEESGLSLNTYKSAIVKLARYGYVNKTVFNKDVFWINPNVFFNGNRVNVFPNHVKRYEPNSDIEL